MPSPVLSVLSSPNGSSVRTYGDQHVPLVDDVAADDAVHQIGGDDVPLLDEEKTGAGDVLPLGVNLLVGRSEGLQVQRSEGPVEGALAICPDRMVANGIAARMIDQ